MDSTTRIWHLMARALNGECSDLELEEFQVLLGADPSLQQQYELLSRIWKDRDQSSPEYNVQSKVDSILRKAELVQTEPIPSEIRRMGWRRWWVAATLAALAVGGTLTWNAVRNRSGGPDIEPIVAHKGSRTRSLLQDGTTVWLNAGSRLVYENDFTGATREVRLEGEAFFDVVKNPLRPFIVHTGNIDIRVLGTAFNVKSYPEDANVETTLYRGLVNVYREDDGKKELIQLKPNQKLIVPKQAAITAKTVSEELSAPPKQLPATFFITGIDSTKKENERFETAWLYSRLEFRGDSFEELAHKLERWYNVRIVFTDEPVKSLRLNGSFENETVEQAFAALKEGFPITYKITANEISVGSSE